MSNTIDGSLKLSRGTMFVTSKRLYMGFNLIQNIYVCVKETEKVELTGG